MKIIIVGCGMIGQTLAVQLSEEGNDITVIDIDAEVVRELTSNYDIMGVVGNGATRTVLKEAGVDETDLLIAVTESDELNLLCCTIAKRSSRCKAIARVINPIYHSEAEYLRNELGLAMVINPEFAAAEEIARILRFPSASKIETFSNGRVELVKFRLPEHSKLVGMKVSDVVGTLGCDVMICTVERDGGDYITKGDFVFQAKDFITLIASPKKASDFFKKIDFKKTTIRSAIIIGATEIADYLCTLLRRSGISLKVVDKCSERCNELATRFENAIIINANEHNHQMLSEEGIDSSDAFIALTDHDEENILTSLFVKSQSKAKIITKISSPEYDEIARRLDLDASIYPKLITSDIITRFVRAMQNTHGSNIKTVYSVVNDKIEATEFVIGEGSPVLGIPLSQLEFKSKNILIAAILREKELILPRGGDKILVGDSVIVVSELLGIKDISDIIK